MHQAETKPQETVCIRLKQSHEKLYASGWNKATRNCMHQTKTKPRETVCIRLKQSQEKLYVARGPFRFLKKITKWEQICSDLHTQPNVTLSCHSKCISSASCSRWHGMCMLQLLLLINNKTLTEDTHYKLLSKFILFSAQPDITFSCPSGVSKPSWSRHSSVYLTDQMQLSSPQWNCRSGELTRASDPPVWRSGSSWPAGPSRFPQTHGHWSLTAASLHPAAAARPEKHRSASLCGCGRVITPSISLWHPPPLPTTAINGYTQCLQSL